MFVDRQDWCLADIMRPVCHALYIWVFSGHAPKRLHEGWREFSSLRANSVINT